MIYTSTIINYFNKKKAILPVIAILLLSISFIVGCQNNSNSINNISDKIDSSTELLTENTTKESDVSTEISTKNIVDELSDIPYNQSVYEFINGDIISQEILFDEYSKQYKCRITEHFVDDYIFFTTENYITHELDFYNNEWVMNVQNGLCVANNSALLNDKISGTYEIFYVDKFERGSFENHKIKIYSKIEPWIPKYDYNDGQGYGTIQVQLKDFSSGMLSIQLDGFLRGFDISGEQILFFDPQFSNVDSELHYIIEKDGFRYSSDDIGYYTTVRMLLKGDTEEIFLAITYTEDYGKETSLYKLVRVD